MSDRQEPDMTNAALAARLTELDRHMQEVRKDVRALLAADAERRGREQRDERRIEYQHDDRWQVWLRALFPVAIITAAVNALIAWLNFGGPK